MEMNNTILALASHPDYHLIIIAAVAATVIASLIVFVMTLRLRGILSVIGILVGLAVLLGLSFAFMNIYGVIFAAIIIAMIISYSVITREALATHVFSTIGAAMRQNLPLSTALANEAQGLKGKAKGVFTRLSARLAQGLPLSEAVRLSYPKCPGHALAMVAAAERIDQLPRGLACIENDLLYRSRQRQKLQPITPAYPLVVMVITAFMTLMLMIFIAPKQRDILSDMGVQLPLITRILFSFMGRWAGWFMAVLTGLVLSVPMFIYLMFRPRRPAKPYLLSRAGDFLKWRMPVLRWFERNYALVQTASFLRLAISAGTTLDQAIAGAAELDVNICYRRRLRRWLAAVRAGQDAAQSARECKVGPSLAWALDQGVNPGNAPSILEMLEDFYRTRYGYLANLARFILWPCVTLLMATVVGLVVLSFFLPIVAINESAIRSMLP